MKFHDGIIWNEMIDMCDLHVAFLQWTVLFCVTLSWKHLICKMRFILNPIKYVCVCVCVLIY